ncbi:MAG: hypothetical protein GXP50_10275 [Deltaproteobacteria bacterium]|nr:hypothetical protein [Deltaproteobacteria bacterium]
MSEERTNEGPVQVEVDKANLFREEMFTDLRAATIRRLVPVRADGSDDPDRQPLYMGETQILTPAGLLPVQAPIDAATLEEACDKFPQAINEAVQRLVREVREAQMREASRIVTPAEAGMGLGPDLTAGLKGGPMPRPGGGKIKLP